jgi:hypothetical protein
MVAAAEGKLPKGGAVGGIAEGGIGAGVEQLAEIVYWAVKSGADRGASFLEAKVEVWFVGENDF